MIPNEGVCICLKQGSLNVLEKIVIHNDGSVQCHLQFQAMLFKPVLGSILQGVVIDQSQQGLSIALSDIEAITVHVPSS